MFFCWKVIDVQMAGQTQTHWTNYWMTDGLNDWLTDLTDPLIDWLTDQGIDWATDRPTLFIVK